jgi:hypothetical protein
VALSPGVKRSGREAEHLHLSSAETKSMHGDIHPFLRTSLWCGAYLRRATNLQSYSKCEYLLNSVSVGEGTVMEY